MLNAVLASLTMLIFVVVGFSYVVMLLWNGCLVPAVDGVSEVTWLQAMGLQLLFSLLFKNMDLSAKNKIK